MLINTGQKIIDSENGLLITPAFQLGPKQKPNYALEGAIPCAGYTVNWLKINLLLDVEAIKNNCGKPNGIRNGQLIQSYLGESSALSTYSSGSNFANTSIMDPATANTDVMFVPSFKGFYSPYWKHKTSG